MDGDGHADAGVGAGQLLEDAGCRGLRVGGARLSEVHANFVENAGGATTDDVLVNAVDLLKAAVAALGGQGGGGRPDMAQGGGPDASKAQEALDAVKHALEKVPA